MEIAKPDNYDLEVKPGIPLGKETQNATEEATSKTKADVKEANGDTETAEGDLEGSTKGTGISDKQQNRKSTEKKTNSPTQNEPSKRVREGQEWNNRSRYDKYGHNKSNYQKRDYNKNNRSNLASQQESSDPVAIRKQVEFYFSDSNLLTDKFLFTKVEGHENLPVPIKLIHSFKRMRHFQPFSAIVSALKESTVLSVVEDDASIQRKEPLPEGLVGKPMVEIQKVHEDKSMAKTVYAKGFGEEEPSTQFDIEAFFSQYGPTNSVRLRRQFDGTFKGSVFVEFDSETTQRSFLALDPKPKWQGKELQIKTKKQYCDDKVDDIAAGRVRPNEDDHHIYQGGRDRRHLRDDKGGKDNRDWKVRRDEDRRSGFQDRRGGRHRGFGRSSRGRGGKGGRDWARRDEDRNGKDKNLSSRRESSPDSGDDGSSLTPSSTPPAPTAQDKPAKGKERADNATIAAPPVATPAATFGSTSTDIGSKKHAREDDGDDAEQGNAKRVDIKGDVS